MDYQCKNHSERINQQLLKIYKQINLFSYELKAKVVFFTENSNSIKPMEITNSFIPKRKAS